MSTEQQSTLSSFDKSTVSLALMMYAEYVQKHAEIQQRIGDEIDTDQEKKKRRWAAAAGDRQYAIEIRELRARVDAARVIRLSTRSRP